MDDEHLTSVSSLKMVIMILGLKDYGVGLSNVKCLAQGLAWKRKLNYISSLTTTSSFWQEAKEKLPQKCLKAKWGWRQMILGGFLPLVTTKTLVYSHQI